LGLWGGGVVGWVFGLGGGGGGLGGGLWGWVSTKKEEENLKGSK